MTINLDSEGVIDDKDVKLTFGQKLADDVARVMGSWKFIISQTIFIIVWILINIICVGILKFDPYPFILLNLMFSTQAAYSAPIIMMSQNRQSEKDRAVLHNDYISDVKSEKMINQIVQRLEVIEKKLDLINNS